MEVRTKAQLITAVAEVSGITKKDTQAVLDALAEYCAGALRMHGHAILPAIGKLHVTVRQAREGFNPVKGEMDVFPEKRVVRMRVSKCLKDAIKD